MRWGSTILYYGMAQISAMVVFNQIRSVLPASDYKYGNPDLIRFLGFDLRLYPKQPKVSAFRVHDNLQPPMTILA